MKKTLIKRGRPPKEVKPLSKESILEEACRCLFEEQKNLSIRGIAKRLSVSPMAIYHYYLSKNKLLESVVLLMMKEVYTPVGSGDWRGQLEKLAMSYLGLLASNPGLLETVVTLSNNSSEPAEMFKRKYEKALISLSAPARRKSIVLTLLVDFLHGFALGLKHAEPEVLLSLDDAKPPLKHLINSLDV